MNTRSAPTRREAGRLEDVAQVLLDAGHCEHDAPASEFGAQRLEGVQCRTVEFDVGLGVEEKPLDRAVAVIQ